MTALGVFFTRGVSLKIWDDSGLFTREVLIYREYLRSGLFDRIVWFTYGHADAELAAQMVADGRLPAEVEVVGCPRWLKLFGRGASAVYSLLMPLLAGGNLRRCDVYKTNQMDGAVAAVIASALWRKPLYVRTGYTLSRIVANVFPRNWIRKGVAWLTESLAFRFCDATSVSSRYDLRHVVERYQLRYQMLVVISNFVDTDMFAPVEAAERRERLVFIGRLSPEKNLDMAIRACARVGIGLDIVGDGAQRCYLQGIVEQTGADVGWLGVIPNSELPQLLGRYKYFILPSLWEGMPKALMEAMASGLVCIGTDTTGINEIIEDGVTGYLSPSADATALAETLRRALVGDHDRISSAGREFACNEFSLDTIVAKEQAIFTSILATR